MLTKAPLPGTTAGPGAYRVGGVDDAPMNGRGSVSWATIGRLVVAGFGVWVFTETWQVWVLFLIAVIVAAAMLPAAQWGDRYRIPRIATVAGVYLVATAVVVVLGNLLVPAFVEQGSNFARQLPALLENVRGWVGSLVAWSVQWEIPALPTGGAGLEGIGQLLIQNTLRATAGIIGAFVGLFLVLVLAAYLVIDGERVGRGLVALLPARHRERATALAQPVLAVMGAYVRGQALVSLSVGILITLGLGVMGVPDALLIGGVAAALNIVPFLGAPAAAVLGILSALNISPSLAIGAALLFWAVNLLEGKLLVPYFVGRATGLHPVAVLFAIVIGAKLAGIIGALVVVPVLAGCWEVYRVLSVEPSPRPEAPS